jgi:hypothetical protein
MSDGKQVPVTQIDEAELLELVKDNNVLLREILKTMQSIDDKVRKIVINTN